MQKHVLLVLIVLVGCSDSAPPIPPSTGDFVNNSNGAGTAKVFGINFQVTANSSGASTEDSIDANFVDSEQSSATKCFTFGDDIIIQLDSIDELEVGFVFTEVNIGKLKVGDEVVIDSQRKVEVNGRPRLPNDR